MKKIMCSIKRLPAVDIGDRKRVFLKRMLGRETLKQLKHSSKNRTYSLIRKGKKRKRGDF